MIGELPRSLTVNGAEYVIRTDYRDILKILVAFNDPELEEREKAYICLFILFESFEEIPQEDYEAASAAAVQFIDHRSESTDDPKKSPRLMDWEQDESLLFPAVNKVAGFEVRSVKYLHWWTFMGYFMEISEGVFSNILSLRQKKVKHKKLEKWEREFWSANKDICVLKKRISKEEQEEINKLNELLG